MDVLQLNRSCSFATLDDVLLHSDCNGLLFGNDGSRTTLTKKISPVSAGSEPFPIDIITKK